MKVTVTRIERVLLSFVLALPLMAASCDDTRCMATGFSPNEQVVIQESPSDSSSGVADSAGNVEAPCGATVTNLSGGTVVTSSEAPPTT